MDAYRHRTHSPEGSSSVTPSSSTRTPSSVSTSSLRERLYSTAPSSPSFLDSPLTSLPIELLDHILSYLSPLDFANVSETCQHLRRHALDDTFWQRFIENNLLGKLKTPGIDPSYYKLYVRHHRHWFLPRHRIWYSDQYPYGKLLFARYDPYRSCIEAYQIVAERGPLITSSVDFAGRQVEYHIFYPHVRLDLNQPSLSLSGDSQGGSLFHEDDEVRMPSTWQELGTSRVEHSFIHTRNLENHEEGWQSVWPPRLLPSPDHQRVRNQSPSAFRASISTSQLSTATFRIRQWIEFSQFVPDGLRFLGAGGQGGKRMGETVATYATLPLNCYTPTKEKPWQGIWCGDYTGHGTEFLVLIQPDDPKPLPEKAQRAFALWQNMDRSAWEEMLEDDDDSEEEDFEDIHAMPGSQELQEMESNSDAGPSSTSLPHTSQPSAYPAAPSTTTTTTNEPTSLRVRLPPPRPASPPPNPNDSAPYKGRLEAIKLTGDPNVPRGEPTWFVQDLGTRGFVGYTRDPVFSAKPVHNIPFNARSSNTSQDGSTDEPTRQQQQAEEEEPKRIVRSVGHVAHTGFIGDGYLPNCLVLISGDRLAQYWETFGFMSFYQRVGLDEFMSV